jgi:hypothetical protein
MNNIDLLIYILQNPASWSTVLGLAVFFLEKYAPDWVPFFNKAGKTSRELLILLKELETANTILQERANKLELTRASKELNKLL